jgi:predicted choloylglycine hydrolase
VGSYTTFFTWIFESQCLAEDRQMCDLAANVVVSLVAGVAAAALGRLVLHRAHTHQNTNPLVTQHTVIPTALCCTLVLDRFRYAVLIAARSGPRPLTQRQRNANGRSARARISTSVPVGVFPLNLNPLVLAM